MNKPAEPVVPSPCVSICVLDDNDVCIGCFRTGHEISRWGYVDNDGKKTILKKVEARMLGQQVT
jgi:predicted Fe-S protein YdhL (DUF1289 family)